MEILIRPATSADQSIITELIREARLNPRNLEWENFLVAESQGRIIGIRQVKQHSQGTREVASGYVVPAYRNQGVSTQLMESLLAQKKGDLYLLCDQGRTAYYQKFGFGGVSRKSCPRIFIETT